MRHDFIMLFMLVSSMISISFAEDLALKQTQLLLNDRGQLNQIFKNDSKARDADEFALKAVDGNEQDRNQLYQISSQILDQLAKESNQDPTKMQEQLLKAAQNPDQFYKSLPYEIQNNVKNVADRVEKRRQISNETQKLKP